MLAVTRSECQFGDNNPLGGLCELVDDSSHNSVLGPFVGRALWAVVLFGAIILGGRIVRNVIEHAMDRGDTGAQLRTLVHNVLVVGTMVIAILAALTGAGLSLSIALTFGGLTSLAIGLAFQDLLRNVLAGIFLLIERPFRIGDVISVGDLTGSVETIELRTTALRLADGRLAVLPNLTAFNNTVVNATAFDVRQFAVSLWVPAGSDLEVALRSARAELEATEGLADHPPPRVLPEVHIDGGVTLQCQYWLEYRDHDPDGVAADLVRRLYAVAEAARATSEARAAG
jgi:small-conductance mechanosensitive channel